MVNVPKKRHGFFEHGLTEESYLEILQKQDFRCAVCLVEVEYASSDKRNLHVDHDHNCCPGQRSCGKCVRGLLCPNCNMGIGHFKDNPAIMINAIRYLKIADYYDLEDSLEMLELIYGI